MSNFENVSMVLSDCRNSLSGLKGRKRLGRKLRREEKRERGREQGRKERKGKIPLRD